jgi:uncharacterized RDD family membrane protein YckC
MPRLYSDTGREIYFAPMLVANALICPGCGSGALDNARFCHQCGTTLTGTPPNRLSETGSLSLPRSQYGAIWRRFFASVIDFGIVGAVVAPTLLLFFWCIELLTSTTKLLDIETGRFIAGIGAVVLTIIADWLYNAKMISSPRQATYGKQFMRLKVTDVQGNRISFAQATGRYFAKFLSMFAAFVGFVIAIFTKRKQALHDIVALTVVLKD